MSWKPGKGFMQMLEQTRRLDQERRAKRSEGQFSQLEAESKQFLERTNFWNLFKKHDYYFAYSDDGRVYQKGLGERKELERMMFSLECPATLGELYAYQNEWIIEEMVKYKDGYARPENVEKWEANGWNMASVCENWTISVTKFNEIARWFGNVDSIRGTYTQESGSRYCCLCECSHPTGINQSAEAYWTQDGRCKAHLED